MLDYLHTSQSASAARSLICNSVQGLSSVKLRLLRVLKGKGEQEGWSEDIFQQFNLRYVAVEYDYQCRVLSSKVSFMWNLQTLIINALGSLNRSILAPSEIWKMPLLRHVECTDLTLPNPSNGDTDEFVLHNLHTLSTIVNLKFGEEVVKRIPNVKKLTLWYMVASDYCLHNLAHLYKLECLDCTFPFPTGSLQNLIFPHSLKKLSLLCARLSWEDINTKIGSLPHLQSLELSSLSVTTSEWETIEGQFCNLEYLCIADCMEWEYWSVASSHFPCLEHLGLDDLPCLKEIPCGIGDVPTLKSIQLRECCNSAIISAKQIAGEQEELGNEYLHVTLIVKRSFGSLGSLASPNFHVRILKLGQAAAERKVNVFFSKMSEIFVDDECFCGNRAVQQTSWTKDNPGRRFLSCARFMRGGCRFFAWLDRPLCERAQVIIRGMLCNIRNLQ